MYIGLQLPEFIRIKEDQITTGHETIIVNAFNEESAKQFSLDVEKALQVNPICIIINIDSYGGSVHSLLSMVDTLSQTHKPIITFVKGKSMSAGAVLLSCGTPGLRFASENSSIMIHEVSSIVYGKNEDVKIDAKELTRLNSLLISMLDKNCNKSKGFFEKLINEHKRADLYLTAKQSKKIGIIDHVGSPYVNVSLNPTFVVFANNKPIKFPSENKQNNKKISKQG